MSAPSRVRPSSRLPASRRELNALADQQSQLTDARPAESGSSTLDLQESANRLAHPDRCECGLPRTGIQTVISSHGISISLRPSFTVQRPKSFRKSCSAGPSISRNTIIFMGAAAWASVQILPSPPQMPRRIRQPQASSLSPKIEPIAPGRSSGCACGFASSCCLAFCWHCGSPLSCAMHIQQATVRYVNRLPITPRRSFSARCSSVQPFALRWLYRKSISPRAMCDWEAKAYGERCALNGSKR